MGRLKPIGSEKLEGMEKIARIMEIARYKENIPTPVNEHSSNEYSIKLADGYLYEISKEKSGYVIKKGLNESSLDYIEPMKNRRHFSSYSGAFKRLNVIAKEVNTITETEEGISLFTEQKKYILKTPKVQSEAPAPEPQISAPAPEPTQAPEPQISAPTPDMGTDEEMPAPDMGTDEEMPAPDMDSGDNEEMGGHDMEDSENKGGLKSIQKLTGKLAQKLRNADEDGIDITSKDMKYVINSILSAIDLDKMDDDDKDEVLSRIEGEDENEDNNTESGNNMDMDTEDSGDEMSTDIPEPPSNEQDVEMNEYEYMGDNDEDIDFEFPEAPTKYDEDENFFNEMIEGLFNESKVEKILKGYYQLSESEKKQNIINETARTRRISSKIQNIAESKRQEESARKFVKNNPNATLIGKSNKNNLLFECNGKTVKVTTNGQIL